MPRNKQEMAQAKVTEYFSNRKKKGDIQPSKRRKVQTASEVDLASPTFVSPPIPARTRSRKLPKSELLSDLNTPHESDETPREAKTALTKAKTPKARKTRAKKVSTEKETCTDIREAFLKAASSEGSDSASASSSEATAACDDHCGSPPCTPTKRQKAGDVSVTVSKKRLKGKVEVKDLLFSKTPEKYSFEDSHDPQSQKTRTSARKKLVLKRSSPEPAEAPVFEFKGKEIKKVLSLGNLEEAAQGSDDANKSVISNIKEKIESLKPSDVKEKLAKCGKLEALKAKLSEFNEAKKKVENKKSQKEIANRRLSQELGQEKEKPESRTPAHERFHSLAQAVPPSLTLPFSFKQVEDIFHSTDVVLSMLDKRNEMCTFSKLKAAVEQMRKKTFDERHLGQLSHVYPEGYILRQEKGFVQFAQGKTNRYQLTIEADLSTLNLTDNKESKNSKEKASMTSAVLIQRKGVFHRLLVSIVKTYHQDFLSKLDRPMVIPEDKLTRWHPKFPLDKIPEITSAALPEVPNSKTFKSAAEVLQHAGATSKMGPRVIKALEMVAAKQNEEKKSNLEPKKTAADNMKGIPQSLLERIRAKEKEKDVRLMMRSPADDQRHFMLSRLPEMVRILRIFFLTEKRPALALDVVISRLIDSCKSSLSAKSMEDHVNLLTQVLPVWIQILTVKKGKFVKVDKNQEISKIIKTLDKMILESK